MNRITMSILLSFTIVISITALNYTPQPVSNSTCQFAVACVTKKQCCSNSSACKIQTGCKNAINASRPDCTKPCCANKKGV